jgi:hypothetical protein
MNVYVDNIIKNAPTLSATNMKPVYTDNLLHDEVLSNNVLFNGTSTKITATWGLNQFADTVAILDSNWTDGRLTVKSQGTTVYSRLITRRNKHTIIKLPEAYMIMELTLELNAFSKLEVGILFVGLRTELPLFNVGVKHALTVNGTAERTRYGIPYGIKRPSLRNFDVTFSDIDGNKKQDMENYVDWVQYVQPHIVEPFENEVLYATLSDAGGFEKDAFRWKTALSYMEAR